MVKLVNAAEARANTGYFTRAEKAQILEVYRLLAVARQEMQTDDSFVFSKVRILSFSPGQRGVHTGGGMLSSLACGFRSGAAKCMAPNEVK